MNKKEENHAYYQKNKIQMLSNQNKKRWENRKKALELIGKKCFKCGSEERLHLHHLIYFQDSVKPRNNLGISISSTERTIEALKYPERFQTLCIICHAKEKGKKQRSDKNFTDR